MKQSGCLVDLRSGQRFHLHQGVWNLKRESQRDGTTARSPASDQILCTVRRVSSTTQRGFSAASGLFAKRRNNRRRAWARTSGAEMWHGQNSPTTSPAWRKWMAELSLCHVNLTESNRRTMWSYKIAGTAAP
jgi:hypothetical protein